MRTYENLAFDRARKTSENPIFDRVGQGAMKYLDQDKPHGNHTKHYI